MAKAADQFGHAEYAIRVTSDAELSRQMQRADAAIRSGLEPIGRSFDDYDRKLVATQAKQASLGQGFSALGAQASAFGGTIGSVGGKVAALGGAFSSMGTALLGWPGIILAVTAAFGGLISMFIRSRQEAKAAREEQEQWMKTMREQAAAVEPAAEAIQARIRVTGAKTPREQLLAQQENEMLKLLQEGQAVEARQRALVAEMNERQAALESGEIGDTGRPLYEHFQRQERIRTDLRLAELKRVYHEEQFLLDQLADLRAQTEEKHARDLAAFETAELEQRLAREDAERKRIVAEDAERRRKADEQAARRFAAWQQTPMGKVLGAAFDIIGQRRERAQIEDILGNIPTPFKFLEQFVDDIRQRLLGADGVGGFRGGFHGGARGSYIPLSAFAASGRGAPGGMMDPYESTRRQQESDRTSYAERTALATEATARARMGAGP